MTPSAACAELVKSCEGCLLETYRCPAGLATIGFGHTRGVCEGQRITPEMAGALLREDLEDAAEAVERLVKVPLSQNQFDALCSFVFNVGSGKFQDSTLLRKLNAGDYPGAAAEFSRWTRAGGKVLAGLVTRRRRERAMFEGASV